MGAGTSSVPATRVAGAGEAPPPPPAGVPPARSRRAPILAGVGAAAVLLLGGAMYATRRGDAATRRDSIAAAGAATDSVAPAQPSAPASAPAEPPAAGSARRNAPTTAAAAPARVSYATALHAIWESVTDPASARQAERRLESYRSRVRTRADSAVVALIDGKAALLTGGAARGCSILRRIDSTALAGKLQAELREGLQTCEGS
jgi:hypothetical protein